MDTTEDLTAIRREIDALDADLRALLRARSDLVARVAAQKADSGGPVLRPLREAQQMAELADWQRAEAPHLPLAGLQAVWREIIGMALAQQGGLQIVAMEAALPAARAHFGASLAYESVAAAEEVMAALAAPRTVGVLPVADAVQPPSGVEIFARLPLNGPATALCYAAAAAEATESADPRRLIVQRSAAGPEDAVLADLGDRVLVETEAAGDDPVWGRYMVTWATAGDDA